MVCKNGTYFFDEIEYDHLKYKHLSLKDYKKFIGELNLKRVEQILNFKDGCSLPLNIGTIKVLKKFHLDPIKEYYGTFFNEHSFGYVYSINFIPNTPRVSYIAFYTTLYKLRDNRKFDSPRLNLYKFWGNRTTLKPKLKKIIREHTMDYDKIS